MTATLFLIAVSIGLGLIGLLAFRWSLRHEQFSDMNGDALRILTAPDYPVATGTAQRQDQSDQQPATVVSDEH